MIKVTRPDFEPEVIVTVFKDEEVAFTANEESSGIWQEDDIHFLQEELPEKYEPDDAEYDPAFQMVMVYAYECLHDTEKEIEAKEGLTMAEGEELDRLFWEADAVELLEWCFGTMDKAIEYVEAVRGYLKKIGELEVLKYRARKLNDIGIDRVASTYKFIMDGNPKFVGTNDCAKIEERTSYLTRVQFKTL